VSIKAVVKFNRLRASARASALRLAYRIGSFIKVRRFAERLPASDYQKTQVSKPHNETVANTDVFYRRVEAFRYPDEQPSTSDLYQVAFSRPDVSDPASASDDSPVSYLKPVSNPTAVGDDFAPLWFGKAFYESQDYVDSSYFAEEYVVVNGPRTSDVFSRRVDYSRNYADSGAVGESVEPWTLSKILGDHCKSCDAFGGESTATDSDVQKVTKVAINRAGAKETYVFGLSRTLSNQLANAVEQSVLSANKSNFDSSNCLDAGFALTQSYVDGHYFADDYVGTRQAF